MVGPPPDREGRHLQGMVTFLSFRVWGVEAILELKMHAADTPNDYKWYEVCS